MKVDRIYSKYDDLRDFKELPFVHCFEGNGINHMTLQWCEKHTIGKWAWWFDRSDCPDGWNLNAQTAYIGFTNSIDLFMFKLAAPSIITNRLDLG